MSLTDLLKTLTRPAAFGLALAVSPVYSLSCGGEESSKACVSDTECKGDDQICADGQCVYRDGKGDSGEREEGIRNGKATLYGVWVPVKIFEGGQEINLRESNGLTEGTLMFEGCNDGSDRWQIVEGMKSDGYCNLGDGGTFNVDLESDTLYLVETGAISALGWDFSREGHLRVYKVAGQEGSRYLRHPGDWVELRKIDYLDAYCKTPCARFLGR